MMTVSKHSNRRFTRLQSRFIIDSKAKNGKTFRKSDLVGECSERGKPNQSKENRA